jgi:hypothetical protein
MVVELMELDGWPYYHLKPNALCVISGKISENLREKISQCGFPQIYTDEPLIFAEGPAPGRIVELMAYHPKPNALCENQRGNP